MNVRSRLVRPLCPFSLTALAVGVALLGPLNGAAADVVDTLWIDEENFGYRIVHIPDWDQRRLENAVPGLPNDGAMYCVPTAAMNILAYIANHGFPEVPPEPNNWADPGTYDVATGNLFLLGLLMGTNPTSGTGWGGWENGMQAFLPLDKFTYTLYIAGGNYAPLFKHLGQSALNGSLIEFAHGWWSEIGQQGGMPVIERNGGHCLTLTRTYGGFFSNELYARDPADDPANTTQSPFVERVYDVADRMVIVNSTQRRMSNLRPTPGEWTGRYLDGYAAIRPKAGYSFDATGLHFFNVIKLWGSPLPRDVLVAVAEEVVDVIVGPDLNNLYYIGRVDDLYWLHCANLLSREAVRLDLPPVSQPPRLVFGRRRMVYMLSGRQLMLINPDPENPEVLLARTLPVTGDAVAYDDMTDEVVVLDVASRALYGLPWHLDAQFEVQELPDAGNLPLGASPALSWDPQRGSWWVVSEGSDDVFQLSPGPDGFDVSKISHETLVRPSSVHLDDAGRVFVVSMGALREFVEKPIAEGSTWVLVEDSPFADLEVGPIARVTNGRTNYDPFLHDGPEWNHVLPESFGEPIADCPADLDFSEVVDFADVIEILSAWGPCPPDAFCTEDLDFSGAVDFGDVLAVLVAWGPCP